jgi:1-deoxy-D-xylulose-5-phosphate reductoisomerase
MKRIAVLGSTGSIGRNTLKVASHLNDTIQVVALAARGNIALLEEQIRLFQPEIVAVYDVQKARELSRKVPGCRVVEGMEGLLEVASYGSVDFVVSAIAGTLGLQPTIAAILAGKDVGLANKEALVSGGALVMKLVRDKNVRLIPIDSEHSAIFQCLKNESGKQVDRLILTSSGGPFRSFSQEALSSVTVDQALNHPTWKMGPKVTVDSSTLMNKGLEVIEAHWLFNHPVDKIEVIIHPQSVIHSMVEFIDRSMLAQMGEPSMIVPIQYALTYPERCAGLPDRFDFVKNPTLQFFVPDTSKFRCLALAYEAIRQGGSLPCYMNAANEVLVESFLKGELSWEGIGRQLEKLMSQHKIERIDSLETILAIDSLAREEAARCETVL